jgi:hypothetical protein
MLLLNLSLSSIHVWIKLHNLPTEYWNATCLSNIASGVGNPICVDFVTEEQRRLGFARVLVEVDVASDFPKEIDLIGLNEEVIKIGVEYPWLPIKCNKCSIFGHATHTCPKTKKAIWVPRKKEPTKQEVVKKAYVKESFGGVDKPGPSGMEKWTVVNHAKKTPKTRPIAVDNSVHWTNSFQLLARVEGLKFDDTEIRKSNEALQLILDENGGSWTFPCR